MATGSLGELVATMTLNTAQFTAGLTKVEQQSVEATAAIKKGFENLSDSMAALSTSLNKVAKDTGDAKDSFESFESGIKSAISTVKGFVGVEIAEKILEFTKGIADSVNELRILSAQAGVTTQQFLELSTVFEESGVGGDLAARMISKMNEAMALAADSTSKQAYILKTFGVNATDAAEATVQLLTGVSALHTEQAKIAFLTDMYGAKQARLMLPVLDDIIDKLKHAQDVIKETGANPSDTLNQKAKEYKTAVTDTGLAFQGLSNQLGITLIPQMTSIVEFAGDWLKGMKQIVALQPPGIPKPPPKPEHDWEGPDVPKQVDATKFGPDQETPEARAKRLQEEATATAAALALRKSYNEVMTEGAKVLANLTKAQDDWFSSSTYEDAALAKINAMMVAGTPYTKAQAAAIKALGNAEDEAAQQKKVYTETTKDATDAAKKESDANTKVAADLASANKSTQEFVDSLNDQVKASNLAANALGLTATQQAIAAANEKIDIDLRKELAKLDEAQLKIELQTASTEKDTALAAVAADKQRAISTAATNKIIIDSNLAAQDSFTVGWQNAYQSYEKGATAAAAAGTLFNSLTSSMEAALVGFANHSKDAWATFKNAAIQAIEQVAAKWVVSGLASMVFSPGVAAGGAGGAAGGAVAGGATSGLVGAGASAAGSALFGGVGAAASGAFQTSMAISAATEGVTDAAATLTASMAGIEAGLAAVPVAGWIALAGIVAYSVFSKSGGGPKSGGSASTDGGPWANFDVAGGTRGYTPSDADTALQSIVTANKQGYDQIVSALGGKPGGAQFNLAYDTDPSGSAGTRIKAGATVGGVQVYGDVNRQFGSDSGDALTADLSLEAQRTLLAALQASNLPKQIADLLDTLTASTATSDQITQMIAVAQTATQMNTALALLADPMKAASDAMAKANETALGAWDDQRTALYALANAAPDTAAGLTDVTNATVAFAQSTAQLLIAMQTAKKSMDDMFASTSDSIAKAGLTNEQLYSLDQSKAQGLYGQLAVATDPAVIADLSKQINDVITEAFGLLSPDDQLTQKQAFLDGIALVNKTADDQMTKAMDSVTTQAQTDQAFMSAKLTEILAGITAAGKDFKDGSDQLAGGVNVNVTVNNTPQSDVNG